MARRMSSTIRNETRTLLIQDDALESLWAAYLYCVSNVRTWMHPPGCMAKPEDILDGGSQMSDICNSLATNFRQAFVTMRVNKCMQRETWCSKAVSRTWKDWHHVLRRLDGRNDTSLQY